MDKLKLSIISAALDAARNLRSTADRLEKAARAKDFRTIAECSLSQGCWSLDRVSGAALALIRISDEP